MSPLNHLEKKLRFEKMMLRSDEHRPLPRLAGSVLPSLLTELGYKQKKTNNAEKAGHIPEKEFPV